MSLEFHLLLDVVSLFCSLSLSFFFSFLCSPFVVLLFLFLCTAGLSGGPTCGRGGGGCNPAVQTQTQTQRRRGGDG